MYRFSSKSSAKLEQANEDHQRLWPEVIKWTPIDFGISFTYRDPDEQFELYKKGRKLVNGVWLIEDRKQIVTFKDGYKKQSKHNFNPSKAVDVYAYINGKASWDPMHLAAIGGVVMSVAAQLYKEKEMKHRLRWGFNWDMDGVLVNMDKDESFVDLPHFESVD